ncbi:hypothetical protein KL918_003942 [Ogataea parapolymorpha]|nr:hypothetical protein KL918_003942 [Ogataea parapolymorpha]KAG7874892.1 hypothetical protein KL916_001137 [Ogataea parapolymorpha]
MVGSTTQSNGFSFGSTSKPNIFGNSQSTGQTTSNALFGGQQTQQTQQNQQNQPSSSPYGVNIASASAQESEMPRALTSRVSHTDTQLKRRRSASSIASYDTKEHASSLSFLGRLSKPFSSTLKYPMETVTGIFTSDKAHETKRPRIDPVPFSEDSVSLPKSDFRKLVIRNPKGTHKNYYEINPDEVLLGKEVSRPNGFMRVVSNFKPSFLRQEDKLLKSPVPAEQDASSSNIPEGYWCSPSIEELSKMTQQDLMHVQNFTAGCRGFGQVSFSYPVDLSAFHSRLDQLLGVHIVFRPRIVQVYPDGTDKPSPGNGMNVPAVISLEKCYPFDKATKTRITDPSAPEVSAHINRLKSTPGMAFVNYDPITGTYTFKVDHFSIWGLVDEDEDDPQLVQRFKIQLESENQREKRKQTEKKEAFRRISSYTGDLEAVPGGWTAEPEDANMEDSIDLSQEDYIQVDVPEPDNDVSDMEDEVLPEDPVFEDLVHVRAYEPELEEIDMTVLKREAKFETSDNWSQQLELASGFESVFSNEYDYSKKMDVSAKSVNELFFNRDSHKRKRVEMKPVRSEDLRTLKSVLAAEMRQMKVTARENSYPLIKPDEDVSLQSILNIYRNSSEFKFWDLIARLFDDKYCESFLGQAELDAYAGKPQLRKTFIDLQRRELLIDWLHDHSLPEISKLLEASKSDALERTYLHICSGDILKAVMTAMESSNNHLSVLLTLIDSNDPSVRRLSKAQLKEWESTSTLQYIPAPVLKVYKLLAGYTLSNDIVPHLKGLSWPTVLLMQLKYGDTNRSISELINEVIDHESKLWVAPSAQDKYYLAFKLMKSPSTVLLHYDNETQFLLFKKLNSILNLSNIDNVILQLSQKLASQEYYEEALFVLEHLSDDALSESEISSLIKLNIDSFRFLDNDMRLDTLHETYRLPKSILHQARSRRFEKDGDSVRAVWALVEAGSLDEAHKLTLSDVAPEFVIANANLDELEKLLLKFKTLSDWVIGAQIYYEYIQLKKNSDENAIKTHTKKLLNGLVLLRESNPKARIAKTLMYREVIRLIFDLSLDYNEQQLLSLDLPSSEMNYLKSRLPAK